MFEATLELIKNVDKSNKKRVIMLRDNLILIAKTDKDVEKLYRWYNKEDDSGWASKYDPGDFSPENQDRVVYQYLLRRGILDLLKEIGDNPDVDSEYFRTRWRKIMAPSEKYITDNSGKARVNNLKNLERGTFKGVDGGKGLGGTWASLPYGCYSSQGCHDWNSERFKSTAKLYAGLLKEELDILEPVS